jgi:hypothetical protein
MPREWTEWKPAPDPSSISETCSEAELRELGRFSISSIGIEGPTIEELSLGFD